MTVKLPQVRTNFFKEMNPQWDCVISKNTRFQQIFNGTDNKNNETFK